MTLAVRGLTKSFGTRRVLDGVDLAVNDGEIHALLGPNGSGKSTLIRCLSGAVIPDEGAITMDGVSYTRFTPRQAIAIGISVIYQNFSLVPTLSVADNVFLGDELGAGLRIDHPTQHREAAKLLEQFGRPIDPATRVGQLSTGDQQLVEIAKALRRRPTLLVLDEPTAALGERESEQLGQYLRRLRDDGLAILYVTHLLGEVFAIADRVTVLRDGEVVLTDDVAKVNPTQVIDTISPASRRAPKAAIHNRGAVGISAALELDEVVVEGIGPVSMTLGSGEVVGVFGLLGSGRTEVLECVYGSRRLTSGEIKVKGHRLTDNSSRSPRQAIRAGVVLVAGDRIRQSIFDKLSVMDNMIMPHVGRLSRGSVRRRAAETALFRETAAAIRLQPDDPDIRAWALSGGNQQKLALGRWLAAIERVDVFLLDEPTQGIDIGARRDLYELVRRLAHEEGKAVLFTSSDPEETMSLADRVLVLRRGRVVAEFPRESCDEQMILAIAHGAQWAPPGNTMSGTSQAQFVGG